MSVDRKYRAHIWDACSYARNLLRKSFSQRPYWEVDRLFEDESDGSVKVHGSEGNANGECEEVAAEKRGLAKADDVVLEWNDYDDVHWERVLSGDVHCNSYCIRKGIIRKAQLAIHLAKYTAKHPESVLVKAAPQTLVIDLNNAAGGCDDFITALYRQGNDGFYGGMNADAESALEELKDEMADSWGERWILKPNVTNNGLEIHVVSNYERARDIIMERRETFQEWVAQKYIEPPLLTEGRKFNIRAYVLADSLLSVYLFTHQIVFIALEDYDEDDLTLTRAHITNHHLAKQSTGKHSERDAVQLLAELPVMQETDEEGETRLAKVQRQIGEIVRDVYDAYKTETASFCPIKNCFELFGFDLILDEEFNLYLLEVNCGPDMFIFGDRLRHIGEQLIEDTVRTAVDPVFPAPEGMELGKAEGMQLVYSIEDRNVGKASIKLTE